LLNAAQKLPSQKAGSAHYIMHKKIRIAIDCRDLSIARTGARTYLEEICRVFKQERADIDFFFIDTWLPVRSHKTFAGKLFEHLRFLCWKQLQLPLICLFRGCDILYCTDYFLPLFSPGFHTAVTFYDAFFWEYPEQYNPVWLKMLNTIGLTAARKADAVITISQYSKKRIVELTGLPAQKIHAIHLAPKSKAVTTVSITPVAEKKYILHLGVLEKRKNIPNLIRAFHQLVQKGYPHQLVLAGSAIAKKDIDDSHNIKALIDELGLQEKVILPGFVSDEELAAYYQQAAVYAFVSINEGFGLPVLEAFSHDLPTIISDNSCLPEIGGDAVITCNPFNPDDIAAKLMLLIDHPALQKELVEKGRKRLALFSWEHTCNELLDVFKGICEQTRKQS
jgi:glycosyltransferase involved in cell wall biosynthesis